jgi:serine/threonine protein kinase
METEPKSMTPNGAEQEQRSDDTYLLPRPEDAASEPVAGPKSATPNGEEHTQAVPDVPKSTTAQADDPTLTNPAAPLSDPATPVLSEITSPAEGASDPSPTVYVPRQGPPSDPSLPWLFGDYEVLEELGHGGMGVVYKARQIKAGGRLVALKRMQPRYSRNEDAARMFRHEAGTAAGLKHPGIVPIYDVGDVDGHPYFAMDFVEGGTLERLVKEGPQSPHLAARIVRKVAEAVHYAHAHNVIHRDIKPRNILLTIDPEASTLEGLHLMPMLADFGLARITRPDGSMTNLDDALGTPSYMPPEQATPGRQPVGPRSDVYSLGAVLYALLTGRPPFLAADPVEVLRQVREDEPSAPGKLVRGLPVDLEAICLKCLEKEPARRYATAGELAADLECFLNDQPPRLATRRGCLSITARRAVRWVRRHPGQALLATFATAVGVALLTVLGLLYRDHVRQRDQLEAEAVAEVAQGQEARRKGRRSDALVHFKNAQRRYEQLLDGALDHLRRPRVKQGLASAHVEAGIIYADMHEWDNAEQEYRRAEQLVSEQREPTGRLVRAEAFHRLGMLCDSQQKYDEALEWYARSLRLRQELVSEDRHNVHYLRDLARSYGFMGDVWLIKGDYDKAQDAYDEAEKRRKDLVTKTEDNEAEQLVARHQFARSLFNKGNFYLWKGDLDKAIKAFSEEEKYLDEMTADPPSEFQTDLADVRLLLAELKMDRTPAAGKPDAEVLELLELAEKRYQALYGEQLADKNRISTTGFDSAWSGYVRILVALSKYHTLCGNWDQATAYLNEAEDLLRSGLTGGRRESAQPDEYYRLSLVRALRSRNATLSAEERAYQARRALESLETLRTVKYRNAERLRHDIGFSGLDPQKFSKIIKQIEEVRRGH